MLDIPGIPVAYERLCKEHGVPLGTLWRVGKPAAMKKKHLLHNHIVQVCPRVHSLCGYVAIVSVFPGCDITKQSPGRGRLYPAYNAVMCDTRRLTPLKQEVTTT